MATLQKIRTNAGVLVAVIIGLALFSFILGDLFQSGSSIFRRTQMEIANIDGESVQYTDFQRSVEELGDIYKANSGKTQVDENDWIQIREQVWQTLLREKVMGKQYDNIGLGVTSEELFDMLQGTHPHPIVQQIFTNPETGQFDRSAVVNFLKNLETGVTEQQKSYWLYLEKQIVSERLISKYNNLINKGVYVTGAEAKQSMETNNKKVNFDFITLSNQAVADSSIKVTSDELSEYYEKHKSEFKSEKTRTIEYISYSVVPSASDFSSAEKWITDIKAEFAATTENIQFVNSNSDVSYNDTWYKESTLPANLSAWIYLGNAAVNDVFGPYSEGGSFKLAKLHAVEMMPDSVQARHILLKVNSQKEVAAAQALADSLKKLVDNGADFAALARQYSTDKGSALNGGDLGWFGRGMMVKPFEDAAFSSKEKEVKIAASQFGLHVIQTMKLGKLTKQVQVAILERTVTPSTQTFQNYYAMAGKFASLNTTKAEFDAAVEKEKLTKKLAVLHEADNTVSGIENPRPLVRAAFKAKTGTILKNNDGSPIFEQGNDFIIATLAGATEEGIAPLSSVKARVELAVQQEKKAQVLADRMSKASEGKSDLLAVAGALGCKVSSAKDVNFATLFIPDAGMEPALVGTAVSLQPNVISSPVKGVSGVYVLKVTSATSENNTNLLAEKEKLQQEYMYSVGNRVMDIYKAAVKIEDKRPKFY